MMWHEDYIKKDFLFSLTAAWVYQTQSRNPLTISIVSLPTPFAKIGSWLPLPSHARLSSIRYGCICFSNRTKSISSVTSIDPSQPIFHLLHQIRPATPPNWAKKYITPISIPNSHSLIPNLEISKTQLYFCVDHSNGTQYDLKGYRGCEDQTSISIAKVAGNIAPNLEVLVVKATTHDEDPTH